MSTITTYDPTNTGALAFVSDLLNYGHHPTFCIHGVGDGELLGMLEHGDLDSLVKTTNGASEGWYLVGKTTIGDVAFTLFGDRHDDLSRVSA